MGGVGAYAWILSSRPAALGLAGQVNRSPAPSPSPDDPSAQVCKMPAPPAANSSVLAPGLWIVQPGSVAGYRAREQFEQLPSPHEAVARTERVTGWLLAGGNDALPQVQSGCVAVDLAGLHSIDELPGFNTSDRDRSARDFLNVRSHPYAVFQPNLSAIDPNITRAGTVHVQLAGILEVNGAKRPATFSLDVRFAGGQVAAAGNTAIDVQEFGIEVPQTVGQFVAVNPHITLEVSLVLLKP
jgi:hypothetical protein